MSEDRRARLFLIGGVRYLIGSVIYLLGRYVR